MPTTLPSYNPRTSATAIAQDIRSKKTTSVQVVSDCLKIVDEKKDLNAMVTLNPQILEDAQERDREVASGHIRGPLHGVPIIIKDSFQTKNIRTTCGYPPLSNFIPKHDAVIVDLLKQAGAIILGKGNAATLAMDMQTDNPIFGRTKNAHNASRTAGGSSGGDAVAVASGMVPLGFGSDIAGSIRLPAAYNGVYGFKPTYKTTSMRGHIPPLPGAIDSIHAMAVAGPIATSIKDIALAYSIIAAPHCEDRAIRPTQPSKKTQDISSLKIAWTDSFGDVPVESEIRHTIAMFAASLEKRGFSITKASPKDFDYIDAWRTWGGFIGHQSGYNTPNFMRAIGDWFTRTKLKNSPMQQRIVGPISVPAYMNLLNAQEHFITQMEAFLSDYDAWICPVSSTTAFPHMAPSGHFGIFNTYDSTISVDGTALPYYVATQSYTTPFALTENPVLSAPIGRDSHGLPIGVQIVGKRFFDYDLLTIAKILFDENDSP